jgi:hypothetical protein
MYLSKIILQLVWNDGRGNGCYVVFWVMCRRCKKFLWWLLLSSMVAGDQSPRNMSRVHHLYHVCRVKIFYISCD